MTEKSMENGREMGLMETNMIDRWGTDLQKPFMYVIYFAPFSSPMKFKMYCEILGTCKSQSDSCCMQNSNRHKLKNYDNLCSIAKAAFLAVFENFRIDWPLLTQRQRKLDEFIELVVDCDFSNCFPTTSVKCGKIFTTFLLLLYSK